MPQHLVLPDPRALPSRRAGGSGGGGRARNASTHGRHLSAQLSSTVSAPRRIDVGVDPALVFKIRAGSRPTDSAFDGRGLIILGESIDYTYFVLASDSGTALTAAIDRYTRTGDLRSFFDLIENIEPYAAADRMGPGIDELAPTFSGTVLVDVTLWPSDDLAEARTRLQVVESALSQTGGTVVLQSVSARRTYLRVTVTADGLQDLLSVSVVEQVRTPPVPFLDFRDWWSVSHEDLTSVAEDSADVGVLDDAPATGHPLLSGLIRSVEDLAPSAYPWQQPGSHGTEVVGRILFPNLHTELRDGEPITAVGGVRVVRVLEPDPNRPDAPPRFATYDFPHELVANAVRHLHKVHGTRVFNLSIGYANPFDDLHVGALTEVIDDLVRDLNIVVVVPAGNATINVNGETSSGHHILRDKPSYRFAKAHGISEPAPAALAVTVGSVALSGAAAEMSNRVGWVAASEPGEASAFSGSSQMRV